MACPTRAAAFRSTQGGAVCAARRLNTTACCPSRWRPQPAPDNRPHSYGGARQLVCRAIDSGSLQRPTPPPPTVNARERASQMMQDGEVFEGAVVSINRGGIVVDCWGTRGFIPKSFLNSGRQPEVGELVQAMFVQVNEGEDLVLSQKRVLQAELLKGIEVGQVVEGTVTAIESYGAFVSVSLPDERSVIGLLHKSELSWGIVSTPESVISLGQMVRCKVTSCDVSQGRMSLSLRALLPDPLKSNLETMVDQSQVEWRDATAPLPGLENVVRELRVEESVTEVRLGRQAEVKGGVSQDIELWLTKEEVDGHFNVVARAGSTLQEVQVFCSLDKDSLRAAIARVLKRV